MSAFNHVEYSVANPDPQVGIIPENWVALYDGKPVATGVGAFRDDVRFVSSPILCLGVVQS